MTHALTVPYPLVAGLSGEDSAAQFAPVKYPRSVRQFKLGKQAEDGLERLIEQAGARSLSRSGVEEASRS